VADNIKIVKDFLKYPNHNHESFAQLIRACLKDILEIDAGVLVKVFDINSYDFNEIEPKSGAPILKPFGQRTMTEIYCRDGASFLKEIDKFGFNKGYWQYCLTKENIIDTRSGFKNADEITTKDFVLGNDGKYHAVLDNYKREYSGEFVTLKAQGVPEITCTKEHPFLVKNEDGSEEWINAGELTDDDVLISQTPMDTQDLAWLEVYDRSSKEFYWKTTYNEAIKLSKQGLLPWEIADKLHIKRYGKRQPMIRKWITRKALPKCYNLPDQIKVDNEFLELAGWFLAEGYVSKGNVIDFTLSILEEEYADKICYLMRNIFGLTDSRMQQDNVLHVRFFSKVISSLFTRYFGKGAKHKKLPAWIMQLPKEKQACLLNSFNKGDGYQSDKQMGFVTVSRNLAWQLRTLLLRQGAYCSISFTKGKEHEFKGRIIKSNGFWIITIKAQEYLDKLSFNTIHKNLGRNGLVQLLETQFLVPIQLITKKLKTDIVYNIHVADVHCFSANGIITHNSYQIPAHPMWFNDEEIVYLSEHPRSMSCYGYSRVQSILDIIKSLHYSTLYNKRFFEETTIPDGILSLLETNETEIKDFMNYWNNEFRAQPHKVAVVNKDLKWQPFSVSQKELEFLETQKWYFNIVISSFGLSPNELGITDDLNRATSATQSELVKRKSIRPFLKLLEAYINKGIIPEFGFEGIEFQFIYDDPAEKKMRLENWNLELTMGIKTINEIREELGLEPISGGDVSNSLANRMMQGNSEGMSDEEESQAPNQKEERESSESKGDKPKSEKGLKDYKKMKYEDLIREHKKLVAVLEADNSEDVKRMAAEQKKELETYIEESKKKDNTALKGANSDVQWITVGGKHIPIKPGQSKDEAVHEQIGASSAKPADNKAPTRDEMGQSKVDDQNYEEYLKKDPAKGEISLVDYVVARQIQYYKKGDILSAETATEWYNSLIKKGVDDGQYYHDQPISMPRRPSGADSQPQNPKPWTSQPKPYTDTNPNILGHGGIIQQSDSNKDEIHCPICGQPSLTYLNSMEQMPEDIRCTACGARFKSEELLSAPLMEAMSNALEQYNISDPISLPELKPKNYDFDKSNDDDMNVKAFAGFDVSKSFPFVLDYANSNSYRNLLKDYLSDLTQKQIDMIRNILSTSFTQDSNITYIASRIDKVIHDKERSKLIARTEIIRLANEGNLMRIEEEGGDKVEFISAPEDGRLCKTCKEHDGKIFSIKEARGMIPIHVNCRCTTAEYHEI